MKKFILAISCLMSLTSTGFTATTYEVQASVNDETFIINGDTFKAKTYCFNIDKDDKVIFIEGNPNVCVSAEFVVLRTGNKCRVWCE